MRDVLQGGLVIHGGEETLRKLERMGFVVKEVLETAVQAGAQLIADDANGRAPAPQITTKTTERRQDRVTVRVGMPEKRWYWRFFETGAGPHEISAKHAAAMVFEGYEGLVVTGGVQHMGMAARPFLRPAYDTQEGAAQDAFGDKIKEALHR